MISRLEIGPNTGKDEDVMKVSFCRGLDPLFDLGGGSINNKADRSL